MSKFRLAVCQLLVGSNKQSNILNAAKSVREAAQNKANVVVLPEMWNCPYSNESFPKYAEPIPIDVKQFNEGQSPSLTMLSRIAKECGITLVAGSIPETDGQNLFNTCTVFNRHGKLLAKYRKAHLFDIDIPGKIRFVESETLKPGQELVRFKTEYCDVGLGICYDVRFGEMARRLTETSECKMLIYPGAFNTTTGPLHWELLGRARAVDTQSFVVLASPSRNPESTYQAWGHSSIINPWGKVVATIDHTPGIIYADIDLGEAEEIRRNIPVRKQRRPELYSTEPISRL